MVVDRVDDRQVVDLTEDIARGVEDRVAADGTVEVLVRVAHSVLM